MKSTLDIKILQWNIRSVNSNRANLILLANEESPDIIFLNETWLKSNQNFVLSSYNIIRQDREDGYGGVAICVKKNIIFSNLKKFNSEVAQFIIIKIADLILINIYINSDKNVSEDLFKQLLDGLDLNKIIIMGDFNSHHPLWDESPINRGGIRLVNFIIENDMVILNDGSRTLVQNPNSSLSAVDLTIVSSALAINSNWKVISDCGNSDHYPTILQLNLSNNLYLKKAFVNSYCVRNCSKADWHLYQHKIAVQLIEKDSTILDYNDLSFIMNRAADDAIPLKKCGSYHKIGNPWWDEECFQWVQDRKRAINVFNNVPTLTNFINAKRCIAVTRKKLRSKKKQKFQSFCETLNRESSISYVWEKIKKFSNNNSNSNSYNISDDLKQQILYNMSSIYIDPNFTLSPTYINSNIPPFTSQEFNYAVQDKKFSAPGMDDISYSMYKNLPLIAKNYLLKIYNKCLFEGVLPDSWKKYNIINILKQNKNPTLPESYRPIVLSSCGGKILEIMIKNRLDWFLENKIVFTNEQVGFRKGRGIYDNIAYLSTFIFDAFNSSNSVIAVFLDIKSAYDNVNIYKLYNLLINLQIPVELSNLIFILLKNRLLFSRKSDGSFLGPVLATKGIPQGSPLSTILFNIYISELFKNYLNVKIIGYADDLVIFVKGSNILEMSEKINNALELVNDFLINRDLSLSLEKCEAVWFTKGKRRDQPPLIQLGNHIIPYKHNVKYLGVIFQKHLKWDLHIENITNKAKKALNVLRAVCRVWWGADPCTLLIIFSALVRSHLEFATIFIKPTSQKNLNKLDVVFFEGLRICLGCMKSTPRLALLGESSMIDLECRRKILVGKFLSKLLTLQNNPLINLIYNIRKTVNPIYINSNNVPYVVSALHDFLPYIDNLYVSQNFPCYEVSFNILNDSIKLVDCQINKHDFSIKEQFLSVSERFKNSHIFIFTDASKKDKRTGFGIYIPYINFKFSSRLPDSLSICKAETIAIHDAVKFAIKKNLRSVIIFSDSKSSIQKISKNLFKASADYWTLRTKRLICLANSNGFDIRIAWIPGHSNILGNTEADLLANIGKDLNIPKSMEMDSIDIFNSIKTDILCNYKENWKSRMKGKKHVYFNIQTIFPDKQWFKNFQYIDRRHITTLIRMRTGHCLTKNHLYKIKVKEDPFCECGSVEDLNHIFLECPINFLFNLDLYQKFIEMNFPTPLSIFTVLSKPSEKLIETIMIFLNINRIKL